MDDGDMLTTLRSRIVAAEPQLETADFKLVTQGWDSLVVEADDRLIFKFPRDADSVAALRREAALLALTRRHVTIPIPDMTIAGGDRPFARYGKIHGNYLLRPNYVTLPDKARNALADKIASFLAELHAIDVSAAAEAGAEPLEPWPEPDRVIDGLRERLDADGMAVATRSIDEWTALPPDATVFGHFDVHGWNMAFDDAAKTLNGIYDFGDAGIGPLHQEFVYTSFVDPDLTERVIGAYERRAGLVIDREAVALHTGMLRLVELVEDGDHPVHGEFIRAGAMDWLEQRKKAFSPRRFGCACPQRGPAG